MSDLDYLLAFSKLLNKLSTTERFINKPGSTIRENLSEHSTQLALTAWYLISKHGLKMDMEKVFMYALIHDIVETYTGDFPTHEPSFDREMKQKLEKEALECIQRDYADASHLWDTYLKYEQRADTESKFIYAVDKLLPAVNIYLDSGKAWKERNPKDNTWSFAQLSERVKNDSVVSKLWKEILDKIKSDSPELLA
jgi:5'-deoxynucleotidase YfbR-like HD superfamily hydrolase